MLYTLSLPRTFTNKQNNYSIWLNPSVNTPSKEAANVEALTALRCLNYHSTRMMQHYFDLIVSIQPTECTEEGKYCDSIKRIGFMME